MLQKNEIKNLLDANCGIYLLMQDPKLFGKIAAYSEVLDDDYLNNKRMDLSEKEFCEWYLTNYS